MEPLMGEKYTATEIIYELSKDAALQQLINPSEEKEDAQVRKDDEILSQPN